MSFPAKWAGECTACGKRFRKGASIRFGWHTDKVIHAADCLAEEDATEEDLADMRVGYNSAALGSVEQFGRKPSNVCSRCFLVHAGECA